MSGRVIRHLRLVGALGLAVAAAGCGAPGQLRIFQPRLQGWQSELKLATEQVRWASASDSDVERVLAEFPLPGARTGRPNYLLYLRLPAGQRQVTFGSSGAAEAGGFLIQTRGEYAGLSRVKEGTVRVQGGGEAKREYHVDLACEDGSQIIGQLRAVRDDYGVSRFEKKQRPSDVQALAGASSEPATAPAR